MFFPIIFCRSSVERLWKSKRCPPPLLDRKNLVHHPLSCVATARDRVAVVMEQGVERHNMTKSQGSWMGRKLCCILVVPLDLGNSEEGCIPPYQTVSNKRNGNEEMWQELTWHFCPTWSMDVSRLFVTSCATQQNLPQRRIKRFRIWGVVGTKRLVINMTLLSDSVDGAKETTPASGYLQMAVLD